MSTSSNVSTRASRAHPAEPIRVTGGPGVLALIREDHATHDGDWTRPGFRALAAYRLGYWRRGLPAPFRQLLYVPFRALSRYARNHYGIELHPTSRIGRRVKFPHQHGVVVHHFAEIGDDCGSPSGRRASPSWGRTRPTSSPPCWASPCTRSASAPTS